MTIICLSFLTVGVFLSLSNNLQHTARELAKNLVAVFFLDEDLPESEVSLLRDQLAADPLVAGVRYVNSAEAMNKFQGKFPDLQDIINNLDRNPFPPSLEVTFKEGILSPEDVSQFISRTRKIQEINDAQFNQEWVERMYSLSRLARAVGFFLGGILVLASFFIISNIIKLNVLSRQDEIEILRLSGASNSFIRIPFLLEGMVLGLVGGLLSLLLLVILIGIFPVYLGSSLGVLSDLIRFRYLSLIQCGLLLVSCVVIGFFGSLSSLRRFLKV